MNNPIIYSKDTNDLSLLLSTNSNPAIQKLLTKQAMEN